VVVATPETDARLAALKLNLDTLLQRYTDQHPDVVNTQRLIRELERQKRQEIEELQRKSLANPGRSIVEENPALVELTRILSQAEVQVATYRARVAEYQARANNSRQQMKIAPQMEAELAQLNRDYEINRKNYQDLVARRESLKIGGELENSSNLAAFRVIDPPRADPRPVAPNRILLMPLSLVSALAAGLGVAFLMSQLRPVIFDTGALRSASGLPLLGVVTLVKSEDMRREETRSVIRFVASVLALVAVFLVGMVALSYFSATAGVATP
jgi:polysaccharide chain length determinant protein (PEP-CTERM system associated)